MKQILHSKKKIIVLSVMGIVALLPIAFFGGLIPLTIESHGSTPLFTVEELTEKTQVIVMGTVISSSSELVHLDGEISKPIIFTKYLVKPDNFIKGTDKSDVLEVKVIGGKHNTMEHLSEYTQFEKNERVLLFLNKEPHTRYGNSYYISGVDQGAYKIQDQMAVNKDDSRTTTTNELVAKIQQIIEIQREK